MPTTLEDTAIDFPVTTLNDLLEAEAKAGVTVGADEEKYRRWAFISTGAAGLLAIILAVVLITGGGDKGGGESKTETADAPPNTRPVPLTVPESSLDNPKAGEYWDVVSSVDGTTTELVKAGKLTSIKEAGESGTVKRIAIVLAVTPEEAQALLGAEQRSLRFLKAPGPAPSQPAETPTTTAPAAQTPAAPTPEAPVPETTPASQPAG
jgi:hypothetical protein